MAGLIDIRYIKQIVVSDDQESLIYKENQPKKNICRINTNKKRQQNRINVNKTYGGD